MNNVIKEKPADISSAGLSSLLSSSNFPCERAVAVVMIPQGAANGIFNHVHPTVLILASKFQQSTDNYRPGVAFTSSTVSQIQVHPPKLVCGRRLRDIPVDEIPTSTCVNDLPHFFQRSFRANIWLHRFLNNHPFEKPWVVASRKFLVVESQPILLSAADFEFFRHYSPELYPLLKKWLEEVRIAAMIFFCQTFKHPLWYVVRHIEPLFYLPTAVQLTRFVPISGSDFCIRNIFCFHIYFQRSLLQCLQRA